MYNTSDGKKQFVLDENGFFRLFPKKAENSYKESFGKILMFSGSYGMAGAACLNILGAKALGAGYICAAVPEDIYSIVATRNITPVFLPYSENDLNCVLDFLNRSADISAVCFGSGANNNPCKDKILENLLSTCSVPIVLDAQALSMLSEERFKKLLKTRSAASILTPHAGEFRKLTGKMPEEESRTEAALKAAKDLSSVVVLKGHRTVVADPDGRFYINGSGNQGLAQAGSGDVLTGMICAMLSFSGDPFEAACMAVFAHGLSADELCASHSFQCMPLEEIPQAMDAVFKRHGF